MHSPEEGDISVRFREAAHGLVAHLGERRVGNAEVTGSIPVRSTHNQRRVALSPVNPKFRNVLCPWQTEREIRSQEKTIEKMLKSLKLSEEEEQKLLGLNLPDRVWVAKAK